MKAVILAIGCLLMAAASHEDDRMAFTLKVASVQMPVTGDPLKNLHTMEDWLEKAAAENARVVVFPETVLSGFNKEDIENLDWESVEKGMTRLASLAKQYGVYIIYGAATPSGRDKPFNSAIVLNPEGEEITRYHKSIPESWFERGTRMALFKVDGIPATVIVCHDSRFPELVRIPVLAGARICFYISYEVNIREGAIRKRENYRAQSIARAAENGIWYVQSNGVGPADADKLSLGNSLIVDPGGNTIAQAPELESRLLTATIHTRAAQRRNALESLENRYLADWWEEAVHQLEAVNRGFDTATQPPPEGSRKLRLALMQTLPVKWDLETNFNTFLQLLDEAADADIFITPECWLDGYAAPDKASTPEKLRAIAQDPATSPYLKRVSEEAAKRNMYICFGFSSLENGNVFNAAGLWDRKGNPVGIYHKTHLQTHDLQYSRGMDLPVWETPWGRVGIMICADRRWPETARTLRLKGAKLILNPTYGMHHLANEWWMRTRGYENQCFIAFAHPQVGFVVTPRGNLAAKRPDMPGVLLCDIDLAEAKEDNHIRDRRPDLYGILDDE